MPGMRLADARGKGLQGIVDRWLLMMIVDGCIHALRQVSSLVMSLPGRNEWFINCSLMENVEGRLDSSCQMRQRV